MELLFEVIIYLLIVLGLITVCFTLFSKFNWLEPIVYNGEIEEVQANDTYYRKREEGQKVTINLRYKKIQKEDLNMIKECIEKGEYTNIYDFVDEVNYIDVSNKNNKKKK